LGFYADSGPGGGDGYIYIIAVGRSITAHGTAKRAMGQDSKQGQRARWSLGGLSEDDNQLDSCKSNTGIGFDESQDTGESVIHHILNNVSYDNDIAFNFNYSGVTGYYPK